MFTTINHFMFFWNQKQTFYILWVGPNEHCLFQSHGETPLHMAPLRCALLFSSFLFVPSDIFLSIIDDCCDKTVYFGPFSQLEEIICYKFINMYLATHFWRADNRLVKTNPLQIMLWAAARENFDHDVMLMTFFQHQSVKKKNKYSSCSYLQVCTWWRVHFQLAV